MTGCELHSGQRPQIASHRVPLLNADETKLIASDFSSSNQFGTSIAIDEDMDMLLAGAPLDWRAAPAAGSVYAFTRAGGTWSQNHKESYSVFGLQLGAAVALAYPWAVGGTRRGGVAGASRAFLWNDPGWIIFGHVDPGFIAGRDYVVALDVSVGASILLAVGFSFTDSEPTFSGRTFIYGPASNLIAELIPSSLTTAARFGCAVSMDNATVAVGAYAEDSPLSNAGAVFVFVDTGTWVQQQKLTSSDIAAEDSFGASLALDGDTLVVGALGNDESGPEAGAAYVFTRSEATWSERVKLTASDAAPSMAFGAAVALDGDLIAVGAPGASGGGAVYLFLRTESGWSEEKKVPASDGATGDNFGWSVALDGSTLVVGAPQHDANDGVRFTMNSGAVYVYEVSIANGTPCSTADLCPSGNCVDGVCCDSECGAGDVSDCQACRVAAGASVDGTCGPLRADVATVVCRESEGPCDPEEVCWSSSTTCPADVIAAAGTTCIASNGDCDAPELCDGVSPGCPVDARHPSGFVCRAAAGDCDVAELCDGVSLDCPTEELKPAGTTCRAATGGCDVAELCDGVSLDCPTEKLAPAGTTCRVATGGCDIAEACSGDSVDCPEDAIRPTGFVCRPAAGACDIFETCADFAGECPVDLGRPGCCRTADDCDDGDACTTDVCPENGTCQHADIVDCCVGGPECSDGDACTTDRCSATTGQCEFEPIAGCEADAGADARDSGGDDDTGGGSTRGCALAPASTSGGPVFLLALVLGLLRRRR